MFNFVRTDGFKMYRLSPKWAGNDPHGAGTWRAPIADGDGIESTLPGGKKCCMPFEQALFGQAPGKTLRSINHDLHNTLHFCS